MDIWGGVRRDLAKRNGTRNRSEAEHDPEWAYFEYFLVERTIRVADFHPAVEDGPVEHQRGDEKST